MDGEKMGTTWKWSLPGFEKAAGRRPYQSKAISAFNCAISSGIPKMSLKLRHSTAVCAVAGESGVPDSRIK